MGFAGFVDSQENQRPARSTGNESALDALRADAYSSSSPRLGSANPYNDGLIPNQKEMRRGGEHCSAEHHNSGKKSSEVRHDMKAPKVSRDQASGEIRHDMKAPVFRDNKKASNNEVRHDMKAPKVSRDKASGEVRHDMKAPVFRDNKKASNHEVRHDMKAPKVSRDKASGEVRHDMKAPVFKDRKESEVRHDKTKDAKDDKNEKLTYNQKVQKYFLIELNKFREKRGLKPIEHSKSMEQLAKRNSDKGFGHNILPKSYLQDVAWVPQHSGKSPQALAKQLLSMWKSDSGHLRPLIARNAKVGGIGISGDVMTLDMT